MGTEKNIGDKDICSLLEPSLRARGPAARRCFLLPTQLPDVLRQHLQLLLEGRLWSPELCPCVKNQARSARELAPARCFLTAPEG